MCLNTCWLPSLLKIRENNNILLSIFMCFSCLCRHPVMTKWPVGHKWFFMKLELIQVWLQDWVGGVALIPLEDYFKATPFWSHPSLCITSACSDLFSCRRRSNKGRELPKQQRAKNIFNIFFKHCRHFNLWKRLLFTFSLLTCNTKSVHECPVFGEWMYFKSIS